MSTSELPQYNFREILEPHAGELRDIAARSKLMKVPPYDVDDMTLLAAWGSQPEPKRLIISDVPLLARIAEMEPFVRLTAVGLEADVIVGDSADYYLDDKKGKHANTQLSQRTDEELAAHAGPLSLAGEVLSRAEVVLQRESRSIADYEQIVLEGHSKSAYMILNAANMVAGPDAANQFPYLLDEYAHVMSDEWREGVTGLTLGEVPAVRESNTFNGVVRYAGEPLLVHGKADAIDVSEELLALRAVFKTGDRRTISKIGEFRSLWPFVQGFRMNTSRPQMIHAANQLPNLHITSIHGNKSHIHPLQEADSLRVGRGAKLKAYPAEYATFRDRFTSIEVDGMGHNATNSQDFFFAAQLALDRGWLPLEDCVVS